jgi:hypothetical protein
VDLTRHNQKQFVWKNLAQELYPDARAALRVEASFPLGRKNRTRPAEAVGDINRTLKIGHGPPGGRCRASACRSKDEMMTAREAMIRRIVRLWRGQDKEAG